MEVKIKDVRVGAYDWSAKPEDKIINFWIKGELNSGRIIMIFVPIYEEYLYKLRELVNQKVKCLLYADISMDFRSKYGDHNDFEGNFLGEYKIPSLWRNHKKNLIINGYCGIKTIDGLLLIWCNKYKNYSFEEGKSIKFNVKQFGIRAWCK